MDVVLFAWCQTASLYLDALVEGGFAPALVVTGPGAPAEAGLSRPGIALERHARANEPGFVQRLAARQPDLLLVAGWPERLGASVRNAARLGTVNCHPSLLPRYRGRDPLFWAILNDEREVGITLHRMTDGLDEGPILAQRAVPVFKGATSATLAEAVDRAGASLALELISHAASSGLPDGREQDERAATHYPPLRADHGLIDWAAPAGRLERLVRACRGATLAYSFHRGLKLGVLAARVESAEGAPGTVLDIDDAGMLIATVDGGLRVEKFLFVDREHSAPALAERLDIRRGARLAHNPVL